MKILTNEHKKNIGLAMKGHPCYKNPERAKKISLALIGRKMSDETKKKVSNGLKLAYKEGRAVSPFTKGHTVPKEWRESVSNAQKGKKRSFEFKENARKFHTGKHLSEDTRRKISKLKQGSNNPSWKNGLSPSLYTFGWGTKSKTIKKRDNYNCRCCGGKENLVTHHKDGNKLNDNLDNLETWCKRCHNRYHKNAIWDARK